MRFSALPPMMCGLLLTASFASADTPKPSVKSPAMAMVQNGASRYVISLASDAIPSEKTAARELQDYLKQITGATFAIKPEAQVGESAPQILVGAGSRVKRLLPTLKWNDLGQDGIVIKTVGSNLILAGGRPRGALYASYQFLEDSLGVRWWTPQAMTIPHTKTLYLPQLNTVYKPKISIREGFYDALLKNPLFATRLKINGHYETQTAELGGHNAILGFVHTMDKLIPIEKYFPLHPEWFSDPENDGKPCTAASKMPSKWQLCLTNESARREVTKNALEWLRKNPDASVISISQNDNKIPCTCAADLELAQQEGSNAGPILQFVNEVAQEIEKEFPHVYVETLAYQYTQKPPRTVRPRRNVVVRLCSIEADFSRPLDSEANSAFRGDLTGWKAIAPRLYVWDYVANFDNLILPHPNMNVLGANIRFFASNNVVNLFEQGDAYSGGNGDLVALRTWLIAKLMWNPSLDQRTLENEFLQGYYGAAAPHLRAYIDGIQVAFVRAGGPLGIYQSDLSYLTLDVMNEAASQFVRAEDEVRGNYELLSRVRRARLALDHAWLLRYKNLRSEAVRRGLPFASSDEARTASIKFIDTAKALGVQQFGEGLWFDGYAPSLLARFSPSAPLPDFLKDRKDADVIDMQEGDFRLYTVNQVGALEDDPKASNGRTAKMVGYSPEWIVQCAIQADLNLLGQDKWHGYLMIRVKPKAGASAGKALSYGIYDTNTKRVISDESKNLDEVGNDEYHTIDLGVRQVNPGMYIFVAPPARNDIEAVYVDRIVFVREKAQ